MLFTKEFLATAVILIQGAQATSNSTETFPQPIPTDKTPRAGTPCDGSIKSHCNEDKFERTGNIVVECVNSTWVKEIDCEYDQFCMFFSGFGRAKCIGPRD
jgi:hypothetical protein